jgi:DNA-binding LacI/PurR family transcriptional regulator
MTATIRDVARRAGVSVSTVSRVLNEYRFVSPETRRRVQTAMEELDYRPDLAAQSMRTGTSRAVGLIVSDISNPLFGVIARAVDEELHEHGYSLVLANSQNDPQREAELLLALRQRKIDGLIVALADERAPGLARRLASFGACVLFDREVPRSRADTVVADHAAGIGAALDHLAGLGHRRVALIAGSPGQYGSRARVDAHRAAVARLALDPDDALVWTGELSRETGYLAARALLAMREPPTALLAGNNQITVGVLAALRDLSLAVPRDLSLVACDDVEPLTILHDPPLDVVTRDVAAHGRVAAELVLDRLRGGTRGRPVRRVVPTEFVPRASSAPVAAAAERRRG